MYTKVNRKKVWLYFLVAVYLALVMIFFGYYRTGGVRGLEPSLEVSMPPHRTDAVPPLQGEPEAIGNKDLASESQGSQVRMALSKDLKKRFEDYNLRYGTDSASETHESESLLQAEFPPAVMGLCNVYFDEDQSVLSLKTRNALDCHVYYLLSLQGEDTIISLVGHADPKEQSHSEPVSRSSQQLQLLADRRVKAVFDYLVQNGVPAGRISTRGCAAESPVDLSVEAGTSALNRRVFIEYSSMAAP